MEESNKIVTIVEIDSQQAQQEIVKLNAAASNSTKSLEDRIAAKNKAIELQNQLAAQSIKALQDNAKAVEGVAGKEKDHQAIISKINAEQLKLIKTQETASSQLDRLTLANDKQSGAYAVLNQSRAAAKRTLMDLVASEGLGTEAVIKAQKEFDALDVKTKNADHSAKDFSKSVGDYPTNMGGAIGSLNNLSGGFGDNIKKMTGFVQGGKGVFDSISKANTQVIEYVKNLFTSSAATEAATVSQEGLTIATAASVPVTEAVAAADVVAGAGAEVMAGGFTLATAGTWLLNAALAVLLSPITLIVVAAGLLYSVFKDYAPLINPIKDGFAALGAVFGTIKTAIFDLVTGARSFKDILGSLTGDIKEAAKETYNLGKATRDLAKAQDIQEVNTARNSTQIQKLLLQSKDLSKSAEERVALINKAQKLEEDDYRITKKNNDEAIRISRARLFEGKKLSAAEEEAIKNNDFSAIRSMKLKKQLGTDELTAYKDLLIKKEDLAKTDIQITEKAQNRENKIIEKANAAKEKAAEKAASDSEKAKAKRIKDSEDAKSKAEKDAKDALELKKREVKAQIDLAETNIAKKKTEDPKVDTLQAEKDVLKKKEELELMSTDLLESEKIAIKAKYIESELVLETNKAAALKAIQDAAYAVSFEEETARRELEQELRDIDFESHASTILEKNNYEMAKLQEKSAFELTNLKLTEAEKLKIKQDTDSQLKIMQARAESANKASVDKQADDGIDALAESFGIAKEVAVAKMIMAAPEAIGNSFKNAAAAYIPPLSIAMGALGAATTAIPIIKGLSDIKKTRFSGKKGRGGSAGGGSAGGSIASPSGSSGVASLAVGDLAANNAAQLGLDPSIKGAATSQAANNVLGSSGNTVVFSEGKYSDFKNQVQFKEQKTSI